MMNNEDEVLEMIQNPRRFTTATVLENLLESIAINLAELTDRVSELTAYMQGFMEWAREQKETK